MGKRNKKILSATLNVFIFVLTIVLNVQAWHWGVESDGSIPSQICGCKWFNFNNGWVSGNYIKFEGWTRDVRVSPLCFQGSIATMMLFFRWPAESHFNGYIDWENQNSTLAEINHIWQYDDINNVQNCTTDDPDLKDLNNCSITGYCKVSDEIARLYATAKIAFNYNYNDGDNNYRWVFESGHLDRVKYVLKNRLGFSNASYIASNDPHLTDTLSKYILNLLEPVLIIEYGHMFVIDGYRYVAPNIELHALNYYGTGHHTSYWQNIATIGADAYVFNLNPDVVISNSQSINIEYYFGNNYIPNTSDSKRNGAIKIQNRDLNSQNIYLTGTTYIWDGNSWIQPNIILNRSSYTIPVGSNLVASSNFQFTVPGGTNDKLKLVLSIENVSGRQIKSRYILDDKHIESKVVFKQNNSSCMTMVERGNIEMKLNQSLPPLPSSGVKFVKNGTTAAMTDASGILYRQSMKENQIDWLANGSNLTGGFIFKDEDGIVCQHFASNGTATIGRMVQAPTARTGIGNQYLTLTAPIETQLTAGQYTTIRWTYVVGHVGQINLYYSTDGGITLNLINQGGAIPASLLMYQWLIPTSLQDKGIIISGMDYADHSIYNVLDHDIKIVR